MYSLGFRTAAVTLYNYFGSMRVALGISMASVSRWSMLFPYAKAYKRSPTRLTDSDGFDARPFKDSIVQSITENATPCNVMGCFRRAMEFVVKARSALIA